MSEFVSHKGQKINQAECRIEAKICKQKTIWKDGLQWINLIQFSEFQK